MSMARSNISSGETRSYGEPMSTNIDEIILLEIENEAFYTLGVKCP